MVKQDGADQAAGPCIPITGSEDLPCGNSILWEPNPAKHYLYLLANV